MRCVGRGARRLCPHCGAGPLFDGWLGVKEACGECGTTILEDQGDPWAFVVILDRVFVLALIGVIYFRVGPPTTWGLAAIFAAAIALFIYTTPHRFGLCVGLVYGLAPRWQVAPEGEDEPSSR